MHIHSYTYIHTYTYIHVYKYSSYTHLQISSIAKTLIHTRCIHTQIHTYTKEEEKQAAVACEKASCMHAYIKAYIHTYTKKRGKLQ